MLYKGGTGVKFLKVRCKVTTCYHNMEAYFTPVTIQQASGVLELSQKMWFETLLIAGIEHVGGQM